MFNFLKKKNPENPENPNPEPQPPQPQPEEVKEEKSGSTPANITRIATDIDRIKASVEAFGEVRKSFTERFNRTSEQIGELRAMILDRDRTMQQIELKSTKASDLVQSVEPEKLMTEIRKQDVKLEALKANLEGNEAIMNRVMEELKEVRRKMEFFRGIDEIIKLSEEIKRELIEIKKIEGKISTDTDKVETIYSEMRKKIQDVDTFKSETQETKVNIEQNTKDIEFIKSKISSLAEKNELEKLVNKVQGYIDSLKEIEKRSSLSKDIEQLRVLLNDLGK